MSTVLSVVVACHAVDTDGDSLPDQRDLDADADGIFDLVEAGLPDADSNGQVDGFSDLNARWS